MKGFGSDNHAGVHPLIFEAISNANKDHAPSYGTDDWTDRAKKYFRREFGPQAEVYFVFNGTAANVLALKSICASYERILCSEIAHLQVDECAAPEFFLGSKLSCLPHQQGLISIPELKKSLIRKGDQHFAQARAVSITQPTELGSCYSLEQIQDICSWAHKNQLFVHLDGARIANAVVSLNTTFSDLCVKTGVDVISFGGTKNGFMFGEAVVFINKDLAKNFQYIRKQAAQLPSKTRFIAAQFEAYFKNDLWRTIAEHSLLMAKKLRLGLEQISGLRFTAPTESNAVFVQFPKSWIADLRQNSFFYVWNEHTFECRLMTSWDTQEIEIDNFLDKVKELAK